MSSTQSFTLNPNEAQITTYFTSTGAVQLNSQNSRVIIPLMASSRSGTAVVNAAGMAKLYPNATAKPTKLSAYWYHWASTSSGNNKTQLYFDGAFIDGRGGSSTTMSFESTASAITNSTQGSTIHFFMSTNNALAAASIGGDDYNFYLTLYCKLYSSTPSGLGIKSRPQALNFSITSSDDFFPKFLIFNKSCSDFFNNSCIEFILALFKQL